MNRIIKELQKNGYPNPKVVLEKNNEIIQIYVDEHNILEDFTISNSELSILFFVKKFKHIKHSISEQSNEHTPTDVIQKALELLNGDRAKDYGDIIENFEHIATIANILLKRKDIVLEKDDIAAVMIALKISREGNKHKLDNLVDLVNYTQIYNTLVNA